MSVLKRIDDRIGNFIRKKPARFYIIFWAILATIRFIYGFVFELKNGSWAEYLIYSIGGASFMLVTILGVFQYLLFVKKEIKNIKDIKLLTWYSLFAAILGLGFFFYISYLSYKDIIRSIKFDITDFMIFIFGVSFIFSTLFFATFLSILLMIHKEKKCY